jgi:ApeA-like protein/HEPN superfamily Apea-like protein
MTKPMTVLEERGLFWLSDMAIPDEQFAPEGSIAGLLTNDDDGRIALELDSFFPNEHGPFGVITSQRVPLSKNIFGILKGTNRRVLLAGLLNNGGHTRSNGMSYQSFFAMDCFVGDSTLLTVRSPLTFEALEIELSGFEAWFWPRSIKVSRLEDQIIAEYNRPPSSVYALDGETLEFEFYVTGSIPYSSLADEISMKEEALLRFLLERKETLEQLRDRFKYVEDILMLLTDSGYRVKWPIVSLDEKIKAQWYFLRFKDQATAKAPELHTCLTHFPKLRDSFGSIWSNWKQKRETFGPGFYMYLGTRRGVSLYAEHRFVNLIWGIEAFHRTKYPSNPEAMKARIEDIVAQVSDEKDKELLRWRLKYAHEPTLAERIFTTFEGLPIGLDSARLRSFANDCAKMRNDISHYGTQRHPGSYSDFLLELEKKSRALSALYHCLILHEIGISEEILNKWVYESFGSFRIKYSFVEVGLLDKEVLRPNIPATGNLSSDAICL